MSQNSTPKYISVFAGCGGASLGLTCAGWRGLFAIEKDEHAFQTLQHNLIDKQNSFDWPDWLPQHAHDINTLLKKYKKELSSLSGSIDLVAGGPPCQGFSFAGRRNEADDRNKLVRSYIAFIKIIKPKILFFENVKGFTVGFKKNDTRSKAYSEYVQKKLKALGYNVHGEVIDFSEFGVPQRRKRFILVGLLHGDAGLFFKNILERKPEFIKSKGLNEYVTVSDAISDLERRHGEVESPDTKNFRAGKYSQPMSRYQEVLRQNYNCEIPDSHRFANHSEETIEKFKYIIDCAPRNKHFSDAIRNKIKTAKRDTVLLDPNEKSPTLTTLPDDYVHYSEPRILTVREYARIQSFPDWFELKGKYTTGGKQRTQEVPRYTQIGNAIPPLFAEQSGFVLKDILR